MIGFALQVPEDRPLRILAIGAHADDIEIGCGGTILRLAQELPDPAIDWLVLSAAGDRVDEATASPIALLAEQAAPRVTVLGFRDGHFPAAFTPIKEAIDAARVRHDPDVILCPRRDDLHQDHRLVAELCWQVFRGRLILEYDIPKWDGDLGSANAYYTLDADTARRKIDHVLAAFPSQRDRSWFTEETFRSVLRLRGIEADPRTDYAEAFVCRKILL
jgi:LmbE family N-acetylglucosaminyl deacetylase